MPTKCLNKLHFLVFNPTQGDVSNGSQEILQGTVSCSHPFTLAFAPLLLHELVTYASAFTPR